MTSPSNTDFQANWLFAAKLFLTKDVGNWLASPGQKPALRQLREMLDLWGRYRFPPYQYIKHDLFLAEVGDRYRGYPPSFYADRYVHDINPRECIDWLEDKLDFDARMRALGLPMISTIANLTLADGVVKVTDCTGAGTSLAALFADAKAQGRRALFAKPRLGIAGRGAFRLDVGAAGFEREGMAFGEADLAARIAGTGYTDFLIQPYFEQHAELARLNPACVNTLRVLSFETGGKIDIIAAFLRIGDGAGETDNVANGGIAARVCLSTGALHPRATANLRFAARRYHYRHPATDVAFGSVTVPYVAEVLDIVQRGARACAPLRIVGWDIAFGKDGPCIFEANALPGFRPVQDLCGPLLETSYGRELARRRNWV